MRKTDVLIVGAGPTGLSLACQLIRYGIDFVLIDRKETTTPHSRAIGVQARTLEIYEQIGIAKALIALGKPAEMVRLIESGEVRGEAVLKDIGAGLSPYPYMLVVDQGLHESLLYKYIVSHGRSVDWQTHLDSFDQDSSGVTASVTNGSGISETIRAKYLAGCDGAKSTVRHSLGLTFEGDTVERLFYVADVRIDWQYSHEALHVCLARHTITAFFPMAGENRYRIVGTFPEGHAADEGEILYEEIERQIKIDTEMELNISNVNWFSVYKVHSRAVNEFSNGRCFVAGDAAHIHTPAGGQGMNTGIQDGYNLAWKLAFACKGIAGSDLLSTYNEERLPNAQRLLRTTDRMFQFGASDDWFISYIRTQIFPYVAGFALSLDTVKKALFPLVSQIGINYRESSLSVDDADFDVKAGDRMPFFRIGHNIYDQIRAPKFHLLTFGGNGTHKTARSFGELVDTHTLPLTDEIMAHFGAFHPFAVLLRPDNHIGLISNEISEEALREYFENINIRPERLRRS
ncbi:MAG: FAD-dependent monooxygenase [Pyrinomonadaceae bacterium]|nr:FAD-dependent monooxygenase [Pyrinomonadaceae bacterium]